MSDEQNQQRDNINTDEPEAKRIKIENESITTTNSLEQPIAQQIDEKANSSSPASQPLTSVSRSEVLAQIDDLKHSNEEDIVDPEIVVKTENKSGTATPSIAEGNGNVSPEKDQPSVLVPSKMEIVNATGRKIEDIIDGSDLRRFLNKTLAEHLVRGLDEVVKLWESGEFDIKEDLDDTILKKKVLLKFSDILKTFAQD